jgi:hypothetical protein
MVKDRSKSDPCLVTKQLYEQAKMPKHFRWIAKVIVKVVDFWKAKLLLRRRSHTMPSERLFPANGWMNSRERLDEISASRNESSCCIDEQLQLLANLLTCPELIVGSPHSFISDEVRQWQ